MDLECYQEKFDKLADMKKGYRWDMLLANVMTRMESNYQIPMLQYLEWEKENPEVISLYQEISFARIL